MKILLTFMLSAFLFSASFAQQVNTNPEINNKTEKEKRKLLRDEKIERIAQDGLNPKMEKKRRQDEKLVRDNNRMIKNNRRKSDKGN